MYVNVVFSFQFIYLFYFFLYFCSYYLLLRLATTFLLSWNYYFLLGLVYLDDFFEVSVYCIMSKATSVSNRLKISTVGIGRIQAFLSHGGIWMSYG